MLNPFNPPHGVHPLAALACVAAVLCAGVYALSPAWLPRHAPPSTAAPVAFALVAYTADAAGALHAETLDSGLSATDCAFGLEAGIRLGAEVRRELLLTCEPETPR